MKGRFIIVSAPSGAGKTSIVNRLMEAGLGLEFSVSATSRPPRTYEKNGREYYFLTVREFRDRIDKGDMLEWQEVYTDNFYGTLKSEVKRIWNNNHHVLFDVDVQGGMNLKKLYPEISLSLFIMPPSVEVLESRLRKRGTENEASLRTRLDKAVSELGFAPRFDKIIVNDNLERAVTEAISSVKNFLDD